MPKLATVTCPVLLLHGERDAAIAITGQSLRSKHLRAPNSWSGSQAVATTIYRGIPTTGPSLVRFCTSARPLTSD
jgi:alpha-beta hydrolase superfamily lysophospholipase